MNIQIKDILQVCLASLLGLVVKIGTDLIDEVEILNENNIAIKEKIIHTIKTTDRHELEIEKLKVEILTVERKTNENLKDLRRECQSWVKKLKLEIEPNLFIK